MCRVQFVVLVLRGSSPSEGDLNGLNPQCGTAVVTLSNLSMALHASLLLHCSFFFFERGVRRWWRREMPGGCYADEAVGRCGGVGAGAGAGGV